MGAASDLSPQADRLYRALLRGVTDYAIITLDPEGRVNDWNPGAERVQGYHASEIVGRHFSEFYTAEDRQIGLPQRALAQAVAAGRFDDEGWRLRRDGTRFWAQGVVEPMRDDRDTLLGFIQITRDRTESKRQKDLIQRANENLDLALSHMSQGLCLFDAQERIVLCNDRLKELLGFEGNAIRPDATLTDLLWLTYTDRKSDPEETAKTVQIHRKKHLASMASTRKTVTDEVIRNGRVLCMSHRALPNGGWVSTIDDVTERRTIENRISHLTHHDTLTALPNRSDLCNRIEKALNAEDIQAKPALLYLDLDRFKSVNETMGYPVGDAVLQAVAERMQGQIRKGDVVSRLNGDEFVVLLPHCGDSRDALALAERLIHEISRPFQITGLEVGIGTSVGLALGPFHGNTPEALLRNADLALHRAKEAGGGCLRVYDQSMEEEVQHRHELERDLRTALADGQFALHYQPVVDIALNTITSFEALLRWTSPTRGTVPPVDFIPFAEEVGLMREIGDWVLRAACLEAAGWTSEINIAVNLSPTQFRMPRLAASLLSILEETGLPPHRLELEITETAMIDDIPGAARVLQEIRAIGVKIAIDDFGTGYSSLSFLCNLPFDRIKIDRSFVQDLGEKPEAAAIVRAIAGLCSSLGVAATAEGVETERQLELLRAEGCSEIQGYLISRPCPANRVMDWAAAFPGERVAA